MNCSCLLIIYINVYVLNNSNKKIYIDLQMETKLAIFNSVFL